MTAHRSEQDRVAATPVSHNWIMMVAQLSFVEQQAVAKQWTRWRGKPTAVLS
jgi:hypothetical protein